jgi:hypothetical protein
MPTKRRLPKARRGSLPFEYWLSLTIGDNPHKPAFSNERERRAHWEEFREQLLSRSVRGKRPWAWWQYDSPQPRDPGCHETLQLYRLGQLKGDELAAVMADWKEWAVKARRLHWQAGPSGGSGVTRSFGPSLETERHWRQWAGIPDELFRD